MSSNAVHPHERGEHAYLLYISINQAGSSPRAWGTRLTLCRRLVGMPVHPHERGEHGHSEMRRQLQARFIPTSVGNTGGRAHHHRPIAVHPHERGEHRPSRRAECRPIGSSPRAWGTRQNRAPGLYQVRFIPTSVGNTPTGGCCRGHTAVHPHERGEHGVYSCVVYSPPGSSPRAWGTQCLIWRKNTMVRFIPTSVGNTRIWIVANSNSYGSSPRAWGTLQAVLNGPQSIRFIPTSVGNTPIITD